MHLPVSFKLNTSHPGTCYDKYNNLYVSVILMKSSCKSSLKTEAVVQIYSVKRMFRKKFRTIHRKTLVPEPFFKQICRIRRATLWLLHKFFSVNCTKFLRTFFHRTTLLAASENTHNGYHFDSQLLAVLATRVFGCSRFLV